MALRQSASMGTKSGSSPEHWNSDCLRSLGSDRDHSAANSEIGMIVKVKEGYQVLSEKGKNLGGPYKTREEADGRLRQVEFFKHNKLNARPRH